MIECYKFPEKRRYAKRKDALRQIEAIAKGLKKQGETFPNATYRCASCGGYHLYTRRSHKAKQKGVKNAA